jgi:hypothetical protein
LARAAKIHNLDGTAFWVTEQDILWFEVTVYNVKLGRSKKQQCCTQLLCKLACQVQRNTTEVCVSEQIIQVVRKQLKDEAQVVTEREVSFQFD